MLNVQKQVFNRHKTILHGKRHVPDRCMPVLATGKDVYGSYLTKDHVTPFDRVREFVDNSIDGHAAQVDVRLWGTMRTDEQGVQRVDRRFLELVDNGFGISHGMFDERWKIYHNHPSHQPGDIGLYGQGRLNVASLGQEAVVASQTGDGECLVTMLANQQVSAQDEAYRMLVYKFHRHQLTDDVESLIAEEDFEAMRVICEHFWLRQAFAHARPIDSHDDCGYLGLTRDGAPLKPGATPLDDSYSPTPRNVCNHSAELSVSTAIDDDSSSVDSGDSSAEVSDRDVLEFLQVLFAGIGAANGGGTRFFVARLTHPLIAVRRPDDRLYPQTGTLH